MNQQYASDCHQGLLWIMLIVVVISLFFVSFFSIFANVLSANNIHDVKVSTVSDKQIVTDPTLRVLVSSITSLACILMIYLIVSMIVSKMRSYEPRYYKHHIRPPKLSDIIRSTDWMPSLSIFQFVLWTSVIMFVFIAIYLTTILGGETELPQIPNNVLLMTGISTMVPIVSGLLSSHNYTKFRSAYIRPDEVLPPLSNMLMENNQISIFRLQMFIWTLIAVSSYLFSFFHIPPNLQNPILPNINIIFVFITGLSQAIFLVSKINKQEYRETFPIESGMEGSNFYIGPSTDDTEKLLRNLQR